MSTPGGTGPGENPYGQPNNPYGPPSNEPSHPSGPPSTPYGGTGAYPSYGTVGGTNPYGGSDTPGGFGQPPAPPGPPGGKPPLDGVSIASLVLSLLCCTGLIGLILGFVGLSRTKDGKRSGRWAAIAGIAVGALAIVASIGFGVLLAVAPDQIRPEEAEAGQCVDVDTESGGVSMTEKPCSEKHDGEIFAVEVVDSDNIEDIEDGEAGYCAELVTTEDLVELGTRDDLDFNAVIEDPDDINEGDHLVCYAEAKNGKKLDESLLED